MYCCFGSDQNQIFADKIFDFIPGLSLITNGGHLVGKIFDSSVRPEEGALPLQEYTYSKYIGDKDSWKMFILMIPLINIVAAVCFHSCMNVEESSESTVPANNKTNHSDSKEVPSDLFPPHVKSCLSKLLEKSGFNLDNIPTDEKRSLAELDSFINPLTPLQWPTELATRVIVQGKTIDTDSPYLLVRLKDDTSQDKMIILIVMSFDQQNPELYQLISKDASFDNFRLKKSRKRKQPIFTIHSLTSISGNLDGFPRDADGNIDCSRLKKLFDGESVEDIWSNIFKLAKL